jgi:hypothetical protein
LLGLKELEPKVGRLDDAGPTTPSEVIRLDDCVVAGSEG